MNREIGSEFWLKTNSIYDGKNELPLWLTRYGDITLTMSGRGAISLLLEHIKPIYKRVLLPSYVCDTVILPFERAGYEIAYYNVDRYFRPIDIEFIKKIDSGIIVHMGYFGFPTNESLAEVISAIKSEDVVILEDVTHTLFSGYKKMNKNDFVIGSIRKWFGIPSGGFLASEIVLKKNLNDTFEDFIKIRESSLYQKYNYMKTGKKNIKSSYLSGFQIAEQLLDKDSKAYRIDFFSENIIKNTDYEKLKKSRINNYKFLLECLSNHKNLEIIFDKMDNYIVPMFFPIYVKGDRDKLKRYLIEKEIYCPIHWQIPKQLNGFVNETMKETYDSILSIPCDQRYDISDMKRIIQCINNFYGKGF